ncbi:hypothetical protein CRG98_022500 [Punica granatum]|uniref:Uncharacterized protein n=1 Tax=Punica granatum TaxID=22663 RepID=A0A2I0JNL7_PUNGR|nr:hypothetical protein CRG98_022500 [Punica granatum]
MDSTMSRSVDMTWLVFVLLAVLEMNSMFNSFFVLFYIFLMTLSIGLVTWAVTARGSAWKNVRNHFGKVPIPGPRGLPFLGSLFSMSHGLAHRTLARMASSRATTQLMAFSLGSIPVVVASEPQMAREILTSPNFADPPLKKSAKSLLFGLSFQVNMGLGPYKPNENLIWHQSLDYAYACCAHPNFVWSGHACARLNATRLRSVHLPGDARRTHVRKSRHLLFYDPKVEGRQVT